MQIKEIDPRDKKQMRKFLTLPYKIYSSTSVWVPPIYYDIQRIFDRKRNPFYKHGDAVFLLAEEQGEVIGRLAVLRNDNYVSFNKDPSAFFYLFECINDRKAALELFEVGSHWATKQGLKRLFGPRGFSVFDGLGMLVEGFEYRPAFGLPYNPPYYPELIESAGFSLHSELLSGYMDDSIEFPEKVKIVAELAIKRRDLRIADFRSKRSIRKFAPYLKEMHNASFNEHDGNIPLTDDDVKALADQMLWFADPTLIKIVMKGESPVGFLFAYPDISAAVQKTRGRLFPFGWIHMLLELSRTEWININGAGMVAGYRGSGGTAILFNEMYKSVRNSRYRFADIVQIGAENENMLPRNEKLWDQIL